MSYASLSALIWSVADLLRGDYRAAEYGKVILPFTVLRRLDCVLAPTKEAVLAELDVRQKEGINPEPFLLEVSGTRFVNVSPLDLKKLLGDPDHLRTNLETYIQGFSASVRDIFEKFSFATQIEHLANADLLYKVTERFAGFDLRPDKVTNHDMGLAFEDMIRRFADAISDAKSGEQFTPRDAIHLMVNLLFIEDDDVLTPGNPVVRTIYDPTAGTGGMLSVAEEHLLAHNKSARLTMFGQELLEASYAICKADMLIKGQDVRNIVRGNTLSDDAHPKRKFDYMLSNPPFGVNWDKVADEVRREHKEEGFSGRFGPGLPAVNDGAMLFLLHLLSKMRPAQDGGSRIGIVLSGSPLFTGAAGSGPSEIRRYLFENDLVEAIIALPTEMFFNTPLATYVWIISNKKPLARAGRVQLIDASGMWKKMAKTLGYKRKQMSQEHIATVTELFGQMLEAHLAVVTDDKGGIETKVIGAGEAAPVEPAGGRLRMVPISKVLRNQDFGYRTFTVERPKRDESGQVLYASKGKNKGKPVPDVSLRKTEDAPFSETVDDYFAREVLPYAPDAWVDRQKTVVGYEVPFSRIFYAYEPPRALDAIDEDLRRSVEKVKGMLEGIEV